MLTLTLTQFLAALHRRRAIGMPLAAMARDLGVSRQAVHQWLSGATVPSRTVLLLAGRVWQVQATDSRGEVVRG